MSEEPEGRWTRRGGLPDRLRSDDPTGNRDCGSWNTVSVKLIDEKDG